MAKSSKDPNYGLNEMREALRILGEAPDGQLDKEFTKRIREMPENVGLPDMLKSIRNLMDECVLCGGASPFVMLSLAQLLEGYSESEFDKKTRRAELEKRYVYRWPDAGPKI